MEDGLSFNQIATSKFFPLAFSSMGLQHKKAPSTVSKAVNNYISKMREETKEQLQVCFQKGDRFSIVIDEWTSIKNRRYLNVCVVTASTCTNLGLVRCRGSMTALNTVELVKVGTGTVKVNIL